MPDSEYFKQWLIQKGLRHNTINNVLSRYGRIEDHYGSLRLAWESNRIEEALNELEYSIEDRINQRKNPSRINIKGDIHNGLASLKSALNNYIAFQRNR